MLASRTASLLSFNTGIIRCVKPLFSSHALSPSLSSLYYWPYNLTTIARAASSNTGSDTDAAAKKPRKQFKLAKLSGKSSTKTKASNNMMRTILTEGSPAKSKKGPKQSGYSNTSLGIETTGSTASFSEYKKRRAQEVEVKRYLAKEHGNDGFADPSTTTSDQGDVVEVDDTPAAAAGPTPKTTKKKKLKKGDRLRKYQDQATEHLASRLGIPEEAFDNPQAVFSKPNPHFTSANQIPGASTYIEPSHIQMKKTVTVDEIVDILRTEKAVDIVAIDVSQKCNYCDYMVICTGKSARHMKGIADKIMLQTKRRLAGSSVPVGIDDRDSDEWIVVDTDRTYVHIFAADTRLYYDLEGLWFHRGVLTNVSEEDEPDFVKERDDNDDDVDEDDDDDDEPRTRRRK